MVRGSYWHRDWDERSGDFRDVFWSAVERAKRDMPCHLGQTQSILPSAQRDTAESGSNGDDDFEITFVKSSIFHMTPLLT